MRVSTVLVALSFVSAIAAQATPSFLRPCKGGALAKGALCGTYEVFEDRP